MIRFIFRLSQPVKHDDLTRAIFDVGPASQTIVFCDTLFIWIYFDDQFIFKTNEI